MRGQVPENSGCYCQPHPEGVQGRTRDCKGTKRLESVYNCNPGVPRPSLMTDAIDTGEVLLWQQDITKAKKRIMLLAENKEHLYALILSQCSPELKSKIKGADLSVQANYNQDMVQLLLWGTVAGSTTINRTSMRS